MKIVGISMFQNQKITGISRIYASNNPIMNLVCINWCCSYIDLSTQVYF
jgi:hypothetical protein